MRFTELVDASRRVNSASGRRDKSELLAALLESAAPEEIETAVAMLSGTLPQGRIGVGWAMLRDAGPATAADTAALTVADVRGALDDVAGMTGKGSAARKVQALRELMQRATRAEQDFLTGLLLGELRQGALEGVMTDAIARASGVPAAEVRRAVMMTGDAARVARTALAEGRAELGALSIQLFQPVQPMLAESAEGVDAALDLVEDPTLEYKVDGARIQVHKTGDEVRVFSRHLREVTDAVPEVVDAVRTLATREAVLDGEVVALRADGTPMPFQVTARRFGRKLDLDRLRRELPLTPFFFDILYLDGAKLIDQPQRERWEALAAVARGGLLMPHAIAPDRSAARVFVDAAMAAGHEGVMVKARGAPYQAGARGKSWLKVKQTHTLDLVVLAAEWGHGRRRGWLSNLHLGARAAEGGTYVMLGKTFKGLTDEMLTWQTEQLLQREVGRDTWTVYVRPELVVEVAFNDVQESPHYPGGMALRFARVKRYRPDKAPEEADRVATVRGILERSRR